MATKIGIDLGTTNTLVATEQKGKIKCFKFSGSDFLKSVLFYRDGVVEIGKKANKRGIIYPKHRVKSSKTYMGDFEKTWEIEDRKFTPTSVAYEILKEVKNKVIEKLKIIDEKEMIEAVITVPAYFTSNQIDETKKAGEKAGLKVIRIITEPVAAAIAYGMEMGENEKLFIMDLGGGTFDVTLLEANVSEGEYTTLGVDGDKKLGGDDFDIILLNLFMEKIKYDTGLDFKSFESSGMTDEHDYRVILANLEEEAENLKIELSEVKEGTVNIPNFFSYQNKDYHFELTVTRDDFKKASKHLLDKVEEKTLKCLRETKVRPNEIDKVVLVGGSCNLPFIYEIARDIFDKEPYSNLDLGTLVVNGATIVALNSDSMQTKIKIADTISHSLGVEVSGKNGKMEFEPLLLRTEKYPVSREKIFTTAYDYQDEVSINIYEGESKENIEQNEFYGGFILDGVEKAKAGVPQIKVRFDFNESRVLKVTAEDLATGSIKTIEVKKGIKNTSKNKPVDFALLVDTSASMSGKPIEEAKFGCKALANEILDLNVHRLGLIRFGSSAEILNNLSSDKSELNRNVERLHISGSTNMSEAIMYGSRMLENTINEKVIVIVTDGAPDSEAATSSAARDAKMKGIKVIAIGAGEGVNSSYLRKITTTTEDYYYIDNISKLKNTFETIVSSLKRI